MSYIDTMFDTANFGVYDMHDILKTGDIKRADTANALTVSHDIMAPLAGVGKWLPAAAEALNISPNINDHVVVPVEIIRSDIPNTNGIGFTTEELVRFNTTRGQLAYKTWIGMGTYKDHANNTIPTLARGVILDVALLKAPEFAGDFSRLIHLASFDRTKDPQLVEEIVSRKRIGYSMGSMCRDYSCSICEQPMGAAQRCEHIVTKTSADRSKSLRMINGKLAYARPMYITGVEVSSTPIPAAKFAENPNLLTAPR